MGGQCGGAEERLAGGLGDDDRGGSDGDPRHGNQDRVKRVGLHHGFQMGGYVYALGVQRDHLAGQARDDQAGCVGANFDYALLIISIQNGSGVVGVTAGVVLLELCIDSCFAKLLQLRLGGTSGEDLQNSIMLQPRSDPLVPTATASAPMMAG